MGVKLNWNGETVLANIRANTAYGVEKAARMLYDDSQALVPVRTGTLKSGGYCVEIENNSQKVVWKVGYVALNNGWDYAWLVHEDLTAKHPNGQSKFLETPAKQNKWKYRDIIAKILERSTGGR